MPKWQRRSWSYRSMIDILLHTLVGAAIMAVASLFTDWMTGAIIATAWLHGREFGQGQMKCTRGIDHRLRSNIRNGWTTKRGGLLSLQKNLEWAVPGAILVGAAW